MGVPAAGGSRRGVLATTAAAVFLLLVLCGCGAPAAMAAAAGGGGGEQYLYKDPRQPLNRRIDDLLRRMTLAEKIGQMSQIERENATADVVRDYFVGTCVRVKRLDGGEWREQ
jgi:beta-glucosidase